MSVQTTASGCSIKSRNLPTPARISVNGVAIERAAISREAQNHPAGKPVEAWLAAARALVVRELLLQEARRLGVEAVPDQDDEGRRETDEEALIRTLVEREVVTPQAGEDECRRFYEQNRQKFRTADIWEVRHILFAADPRDRGARDEAKARAEAATSLLAAAPEQFAALAAELSACSSSQSGGSLGQITRGQTVREFEAALERMRPETLSPDPIETRYGYHVVRLDRRIDGAPVPYDAARARIGEWLEEKVRRTAVRHYIAALASRAEIKGLALDASSSPLVQ